MALPFAVTTMILPVFAPAGTKTTIWVLVGVPWTDARMFLQNFTDCRADAVNPAPVIVTVSPTRPEDTDIPEIVGAWNGSKVTEVIPLSPIPGPTAVAGAGC